MYIFHSRNADTLCRKNAPIPILSSMLLSHYNRHFVVQVALTCFDVRILKYFHDGPLNVLKGVSLTLLGSRHIECRDSLLESIWPQLSSIFSLRFSCRRCLTFFFLSPTSTSSGLQLVVLTLSAVLFFGSLLSRLFFSPLLPFFLPVPLVLLRQRHLWRPPGYSCYKHDIDQTPDFNYRVES